MYKMNYKVDILDIDWTEYKKNRKVNKSRRGRKHNNLDVYWPQVSPKKIKQFYSDYSEKNQTCLLYTSSYEKLFGAKAKSDTDVKNECDGKDTSITRTARLFYIACTSAKNSLAIVAYTENNCLLYTSRCV